MIFLLQHACGFEYTAKLQKMLVDINLSAFIMQEFNESVKSSIMSGFSVLVLQVQDGVWFVQEGVWSCTGRGVVMYRKGVQWVALYMRIQVH